MIRVPGFVLLSLLPPLLLSAVLLRAPAAVCPGNQGGVVPVTWLGNAQGVDLHRAIAREMNAGMSPLKVPENSPQNAPDDALESAPARPATAPASSPTEVDPVTERVGFAAVEVLPSGLLAGAGAAYLPAAQLTERPQPMQDIVPDWTEPEVIPRSIDGVLLISEYGDVDRVLLDDRGLTLLQQQALRERFEAVRFVPGQLYGRPVRSALRIEIRVH